ncbi:hypothetical protein Q669_21520 [Labrenzia sp. C1B10]|nr:hypothetical protein Q669_21520 [Labrenzia sp. C1B10]ERS01580.1 hypothetical protein Q675_05635 [Labrenzia sp. C1B70]
MAFFLLGRIRNLEHWRLRSLHSLGLSGRRGGQARREAGIFCWRLQFLFLFAATNEPDQDSYKASAPPPKIRACRRAALFPHFRRGEILLVRRAIQGLPYDGL